MKINAPFPTPARDVTAQPLGTFADEIDEEKIIQQAAEILARRGERKPVEPIPPRSIPEGETIVIHVLDAFSLDGWRNSKHERGATVIVSHDQVNTPNFWDHRNNENLFDYMLAEGKRIREGAWPSWMPVWRYGDRTWAQQRAQAFAEAKAIRDSEERTIAMQAVERTYGDSNFNPASAHEFYKRLFARPEAVDYFEEDVR